MFFFWCTVEGRHRSICIYVESIQRFRGPEGTSLLAVVHTTVHHLCRGGTRNIKVAGLFCLSVVPSQ